MEKDARDAESFKRMEQEFILRELSSKKTSELGNDRVSVSNFVKEQQSDLNKETKSDLVKISEQKVNLGNQENPLQV